ncbi:MAG: hypothetical protein LE180_04010 [Endomicrobium sp.]|uniref:hypothetical protein n=1 Tax=Candidatus Endomicrobiellum pyrsonymphae TaxID=1408203 RepID=UPI0035742F0A|nr:hypothetical protein [Endomicrobium sp.]MCA6070257.1 hypothetical protein [Endomicrobium sp.]MCA6070258.1 hypothetical protein [Endomicrobium sp.]MCA6070259.1 hypothetical protein [Endomicrobium sp.]
MLKPHVVALVTTLKVSAMNMLSNMKAVMEEALEKAATATSLATSSSSPNLFSTPPRA